jgi:hypothetical protein
LTLMVESILAPLPRHSRVGLFGPRSLL